MTFLDSVILGVVEGITEFLPISSTGHLILFGNILNIGESEFLKSFNIAIQFGAILAVVYLFPKRFFKEFSTFKKIAIAFIPTVVLGLIFYSIIKKYLLGNVTVVLVALFVGGILFILLEKFLAKKEIKKVDEGIEGVTYKQSFFIGLYQSLAMIPGVSRSASTIFGGMLMGISRKTIVEFSFLLAVPTMLAATVLDVYKNFESFKDSQLSVLSVGFVVSFIVAIFAIKFLIRYVEKNNFIAFGVYRIIAAIVFWIVLF